MFETFQKLPDIYQGLIYLLFGIIMLLYALGIIEKVITPIVIALALYLIGIGCIKTGVYHKIKKLIFSKE